MSLRKEVAPKGMSFSASEFFISDTYATILTVVSFPAAINPGYLAELVSNVSGTKIVAKHIPIAFSVLAKMLNKQLADIQDKYQKYPQAHRVYQDKGRAQHRHYPKRYENRLPPSSFSQVAQRF